jgi:predicted NACHT family NTPase
LCFYGDFGSGKTTFFDFLKVKIAQRKIIAIYIQLYGAFDLHSIIISFKSKLFEELAQIYKLKTNHNPIGSELDPEKATKEILSELTRKYETEGFVVFIDELHKGDHDNALKFMNFLQTYKREFIDAYCNIKDEG